MAVVVDRKNGHLKAKLLQHAQWIVDGRMLDGGADDVLSRSLIRPGCTDQGHVVGLGTAGGKQDFLFLHLHGIRDDLSRVADVLLCLHALAVLGSRIAVVLCHCFHHDVPYTVEDLCGS